MSKEKNDDNDSTVFLSSLNKILYFNNTIYLGEKRAKFL